MRNLPTQLVCGLIAIFLLPIAGEISAAVVTDFSVFGGSEVTFGGGLGHANNHVGPLGSNGSISFNNNGITTSISGGGSLTAGGGAQAYGDILVNGDVTFGNNAKVDGDIHSGGSVKFGSMANVSGDIRAKNNVSFGNNGKVQGNVDAGGNATFSNNNGTSIGKNLTLGGTITGTNQPIVTGTTTQSAPSGAIASPKVFAPVSVPDASTFSPSGVSQNVGTNGVISLTPTPDSYMDISFTGNGTLKLTLPGIYILNSLTAGAKLDILLDLDNLAGEVFKILVKESVDIGGSLEFRDLLTNVKYDAFGPPGGQNPTSQAELGKMLYLEVGKDFEVDGNAEWFGTIFAPNGNITFGGGADVAGALYAKEKVEFKNNANIYFAKFDDLPSQFGVVPEPASLLVWSLLAVACGARVALRKNKQ